MSEDMLILFSFLLFMGIFAGVGIASMWVKTDTTDDYLVAGRGMHPALAALSAVSTWNSGYMFIGFIGFIFLQAIRQFGCSCVDNRSVSCLDLALQVYSKRRE